MHSCDTKHDWTLFCLHLDYEKIHTCSKIAIICLDTMVTDWSKHGLHINHILAASYGNCL